MKTQKERLDEILKTNNFNYKMKDIFLVFGMGFEGYEKKSQTVKAIKKKITKEEWNSLVNGITMTFFYVFTCLQTATWWGIKIRHDTRCYGYGCNDHKEKSEKEKEMIKYVNKKTRK